MKASVNAGRSARRLGLVLVAVAAASASPVSAQGIWPENPENLQVLPADTDLSGVMRGWTGALGVRCSYCHVGVEGEPLTTYDFASDANPMKDRARAMVEMLGEIRNQLAAFESSGMRVQMTCATCHSGRARPQTLEEAVTEKLAAEGEDAVIPHYQELRSRYFGGPAYDFRPGSVDDVARALHGAGASAVAFALLNVNAEDHPDWVGAWATMGALAAEDGEIERARTFYQRALEMEPENPLVQRALAALGGERLSHR